MADRGEDISAHFANQFTVVRPAVQRVNVDFTTLMLKELHREAETLNISRQAVIKPCFVRRLTGAISRSRGVKVVRTCVDG